MVRPSRIELSDLGRQLVILLQLKRSSLYFKLRRETLNVIPMTGENCKHFTPA